MIPYKIGTRVRFIHRTDCVGTVISNVFRSQNDGGPRQLVAWDNLDTTSWDPCFLRPESSSLASDPELVRSGDMISRKKFRLVKNSKGQTVMLKQGLQKIIAKGNGWN